MYSNTHDEGEAAGETQKLQHTEEDYDPFLRPPNLEIARKHGAASRYAKVPSNGHEAEKCPCCGLPTVLDEFSMCSSHTEFTINGPGIALYFDFVLLCVGFMLLYGYPLRFTNPVRAMSATYNVWANWDGERCNQQQACTYYTLFALTNRTYETSVGPILNLLVTVAFIAIELCYHGQIEQLAQEIDLENVGVQDYSIMIQDMPADSTKIEVHEFFSRLHKEVKQVCMGYDITLYNALLTEFETKELLLTKLLDQELEGDAVHDERVQLEQDIYGLELKLDELEQKHEKLLRFSGVCFVVLQTQQEVEEVLRMFSMSRLEIFFLRVLSLLSIDQRRLFKGHVISIQRAPQPGDVLWENLGVSFGTLLWRKVLTWGASLIVLVICFAFILAISLIQVQVNLNYRSSLAGEIGITAIGFVASLLIVLINTILGVIMKSFSALERQSTQTVFNISIAKKLSIVLNSHYQKAQFLNTAIITLFVNYLIMDKHKGYVHQITDSGGLTQDVVLIMFVNCFSSALLTIFNPYHLVRNIKRRKIIEQGSKCTLTQKQVNAEYEGTQFDLAKRYSQTTKTIMMTLFYAYLLPVGILFGVGSLAFSYWVEKWSLLRRDARPPPLSDQLATEMVNFQIELAILIFGLGCCFWEYIIFEELNWFSMIQLGVAVLYYIIPTENLCRSHLGLHSTQKYDDVKHLFWDDYDRRNPLTMQKAIDQWVSGDEEVDEAKRQTKSRLMNKFIMSNLRMAQNKAQANRIHRGFKRPTWMKTPQIVDGAKEVFSKIDNTLRNFVNFGQKKVVPINIVEPQRNHVEVSVVRSNMQSVAPSNRLQVNVINNHNNSNHNNNDYESNFSDAPDQRIDNNSNMQNERLNTNSNINSNRLNPNTSNTGNRNIISSKFDDAHSSTRLDTPTTQPSMSVNTSQTTVRQSQPAAFVQTQPPKEPFQVPIDPVPRVQGNQQRNGGKITPSMQPNEQRQVVSTSGQRQQEVDSASDNILNELLLDESHDKQKIQKPASRDRQQPASRGQNPNAWGQQQGNKPQHVGQERPYGKIPSPDKRRGNSRQGRSPANRQSGGNRDQSPQPQRQDSNQLKEEFIRKTQEIERTQQQLNGKLQELESIKKQLGL